VLEAALVQKGHFAADELYLELKNNKSNVSRATVYNTLDLLEKCNLLLRRNFGGKTQRYEKITPNKNHDHLVCSRCGRIVEFNSSGLNKLIRKIAEENNFEFRDYSINIFVKCNDEKECKAQAEKRNS